MRHVPYPVTIITATDTSESPDKGPARWRGATVSSFNTVALYPHPVVTFNIKRPSSTLDAIQATGHFNAHLFSYSREAKRIATKFTKGNAGSPFHDKDGNLESFALDAERQANDLPPLLFSETNSEVRMNPFRFQCRLLEDKSVEIGDHVVLFGEVSRVIWGEKGLESSAQCMVYVNGRYKAVYLDNRTRVKRLSLQKLGTDSGGADVH